MPNRARKEATEGVRIPAWALPYGRGSEKYVEFLFIRYQNLAR